LTFEAQNVIGLQRDFALRNDVVFSNDPPTNDDAAFNTLADEQAAAWARFYAIEVDSCPGELEHDRALAAAKRLDAAIIEAIASGERAA
jgi:hypothetical protein